MAGRIGHSDQSANAGLGEGDLVILCEVLDQVRNKYYYLGLHIGLLSSEIDCIVEDASRSSRDCLREVLKARLKENSIPEVGYHYQGIEVGNGRRAAASRADTATIR